MCSTSADYFLILSTLLCAMGISRGQFTCARRSRSRLSCIQFHECERCERRSMLTQAMQFLAQRGKWCGNGAEIHVRRTAGMPVRLSRTRAGAVESSRCGDAQRDAEFCVEFCVA